MRPSPDVAAKPLFECLDCGSRRSAPDGGACDGCGGPLYNLAVERDL